MSKRVLVFESDAKFADELRENFQDMGASVGVFGDGDQGIADAMAHKPDVILLSIELAGVNGFLVCKKLKKSAELKDVPVIVLSSEATDDIFDQHKKLKTRAELYLHKPITFGALFDHLRPFVNFAEGRPSREIEVDSDMVELGDVELEDAVVADDGNADSQVDEEIDAFADNAFDALMMREEDDATNVGVIPNSLVAAATSERAGATSRPPAARTSIAPRAADTGALDEMRAELASLRSQLSESKNELTVAKRRAADVEKLEKEIADLKLRAAKGGGVSSREFLDLREALNKKEKESLDLKDQVSARDKQLLDASDKALVLERQGVDYQERIAILDGELATTKSTLSALSADRETIQKRAEDLKTRLERAETKGKKLEEALDAEKEARNADVAKLTSDHEAAVAKSLADHQAAIELAQESHDTALARLRAESATKHEDLVQKHAEEVAELRASGERSLRDARSAHASELETLRAEHNAAVAAKEEAHSAAVEKLTSTHTAVLALRASEAEEAKDAALEALRADLLAETESRLADADKKRVRELAEAARAHEAAMSELRAELEEKAAAELQAAGEKHGRELAVLGRKLTETETSLSTAAADLEQKTHNLAAARATISEHETTISSHEERIEELEERVADLTAKLSRATTKIGNDAQILERARKAAAIALGLLDDQTKNALED